MTLDHDVRAVDLNAWFDHVPRLTIDVGPRRLPVFRSLGIAGFHVALVVAVLVSLVNDVPLMTSLGLSAVAGLSFFMWALLRRAVTGRESLVLLEHAWVAFAAVAGFLWLSGGPIVAGLDVLAVALCWFLAFGRLGCTAVGCCHGVPSRVGIAYGPEHGLPPRLTGRRLLPVPLLEALGLVLIGMIGLALVGGTPGRATVWFLVAYASLRFGTEALRGGARPSLLGVSLPRAMCVLQAGAGVVAAEAWLVRGPPDDATVVGALALLVATGAGLGLVAARGRNPLVLPHHLDEVWELVTVLARSPSGPVPVVGHTAMHMTVAVSNDMEEGLHLSLSHPTHPTFAVAVALAPDDIVERSGITHLLFGAHLGGSSRMTEYPRAIADRLPQRGADVDLVSAWRRPDQTSKYFERSAAISGGQNGY